MVDRLEELERLNALHERGSLTAEEFEQAKANLLGNEARASKKLPPGIVPICALVGLIVAVFVVKPLISGSPSGNASASQPAATAESGDGWVVAHKTDAMTDASVSTAVKMFAGTAGDIEVTLSCASTGQISYQLASFNKSREPLEMRSQVGPNMEDIIPYEMRVDGGDVGNFRMYNSAYSNVIAFKSPGPTIVASSVAAGEATQADDAARAQRLTFALHLANSDETIVVDQSGTVPASVLQPCNAIREPQIRRAEQQAAAIRKELESPSKSESAEPPAEAM